MLTAVASQENETKENILPQDLPEGKRASMENSIQTQKDAPSALSSKTPNKKPKKLPLPLSYIKNGKAYFNEKKLNFKSLPSTISDLARFHDWFAHLENNLDTFPLEYYGLIAKLIQESYSFQFQFIIQ